MQFGPIDATPRVLAAAGAVLFATAAGSVAASLPSVDSFPVALLVLALVFVAALAAVPGAWATLYRRTGVGVGAWFLALAVAAGGIALSHAVVGDPQPVCEGVGRRGCLTGYGWASVIYLASAFAVAIGAGHLGRYWRLRRASVEPAAEVASGAAFDGDSGLVAVEGRVEPATEPLEAPVSGEPAVWYRCATERPRAALNGAHVEDDVETASADWYVEDGSGRVLVRPGEVDPHDAAELLRSATVRSDHGAAAADGAAAAADGSDEEAAADADGSGGREATVADGGDGAMPTERHREWRLEPGDAVAVVGVATDVSRAEFPEPVAIGVEGRTIVGRGTLGDLRRWAARRALLGSAIAVLLGGASLVAMLWLA